MTAIAGLPYMSFHRSALLSVPILQQHPQACIAQHCRYGDLPLRSWICHPSRQTVREREREEEIEGETERVRAVILSDRHNPSLPLSLPKSITKAELVFCILEGSVCHTAAQAPSVPLSCTGSTQSVSIEDHILWWSLSDMYRPQPTGCSHRILITEIDKNSWRLQLWNFSNKIIWQACLIGLSIWFE